MYHEADAASSRQIFYGAPECWRAGYGRPRPGVVQTYGRREGRNVMLLGSGGWPVPWCAACGGPRSQAAGGTGGSERECCCQAPAHHLPTTLPSLCLINLFQANERK
ncbi:hypothetical protein E2C01_066549 [Portunus trituberculatus]|uniref:Uncharacterized protein n=1 Tax=Portunus trituberculatus TaxID=210409 RepID=A0A5B7HHE2_PORTR|nr:hypothetical protein [Portunus trituberculatus]